MNEKKRDGKILPFTPGAPEEPELEALTRPQLEDYLARLEVRIQMLDQREPADEASEAYEAWADAHEELEDLRDEVLDRLEELD